MSRLGGARRHTDIQNTMLSSRLPSKVDNNAVADILLLLFSVSLLRNVVGQCSVLCLAACRKNILRPRAKWFKSEEYAQMFY